MPEKNNYRLPFILAVAALCVATSASAAPKQDKGGKHEHEHEQSQDRAGQKQQEVLADMVFSDIERRLMCDYFKVSACGSKNLLGDGKQKHRGDVGSGNKTAMLPPGLAKRDALPPGLERQYQRNGKLPPGLDKRQMPDDLARTLPRRSHDYERVIVGNDVLLISIATGVILDILEGVATGR